MLLNEDKIEPSKCYISARVLCLLTHLRQPVGEPRNAGQYKSHADRSIHQGPFRIASPPLRDRLSTGSNHKKAAIFYLVIILSSCG